MQAIKLHLLLCLLLNSHCKATAGILDNVKLATWNVNSIRARTQRVANWLNKNDIDVLAIQETKATDEQFPWEIFERSGYEVAHFGLNQWNGVAIASRVGLSDVERGFPNQPTFKNVLEPRAIAATCAGVRVWSLYVPNGRSLIDVHLSYKLDWLKKLHQNVEFYLQQDPQMQIALMGDWNIAPEDKDVWDMAEFENSTHVSPAEREIFQTFLATGYKDVVRPFYPDAGTYTYWDYKGFRFSKGEGMRIDFILTSPALFARVKSAIIDCEERKGKAASDHAPVIVELFS